VTDNFPSEDVDRPVQVRLLVLCAGDPDSERAFSGSARALIQALEARGCVAHKANVLGMTDPFKPGNGLVRTLRRLDRFGIEDRYRWSKLYCSRNSRRAERIAASVEGYNACLMYGTSYLPRLNVPTYCYFDATAAQVYAARAWEFADMREDRANRVIAYQKDVFDMCTGIFPRTDWAGRSVAEDYGVAEEKITVAGAGSNYQIEPLAHGPYDRQTILFIGSEWERKGGPLIAEAFRIVRKNMPQARLVIIGCAPQIDLPGVEVVGRISKDAPGGLNRLMAHYSEASLFCIMSTFEPFGIVVIEAQQAGVPCVVPMRFAFTETVVDGETGRQVAGEDPEHLAQVFLSMLRDPARLRMMGEAGQRFVAARWTWAEAARRIEERVQQDLAAVNR
jgi:glycosyltransferase involved in cell wall biosynthesis